MSDRMGISLRPKSQAEHWRYLARYWHLSVAARQRLEWLIFYYSVGKRNARATAAYFGISRKTLHQWKQRFNPKLIQSLEAKSTAPHRKRTWQVTEVQEGRIVKLRQAYIKYGKQKLKRLYQKEYGKDLSTWKIERVIRKHKLYPDPAEHKKRVEKRKNATAKVRIHEIREAIAKVKQFGFLWHIDAIIIWWYGERRIIFTALEDKTKIAYARVYKSNTSGFAEDFLKRLMYLVEGKVELMHSDNGSEFAGEFEKACRALQILQVYSRPNTPKDNPALERFNGTVQEEWLDFSEVGLDEINNANHDLTTWLIKYNSYRPHETLDYLTPLEYAQQTFFKVSPMWSASTNIVQGCTIMI